MASSRSGASQTLTIGNTALQEEDNLQGFALNFDPATFDKTSGGVTTTENAGPVAVGGSFSCYETERTLPLLLGRNGARVDLTWTDGTDTPLDDKECILTVSRVFEDRGPRRFQVDFEVDGTPSDSAVEAPPEPAEASDSDDDTEPAPEASDSDDDTEPAPEADEPTDELPEP